MDQTFDNDRIIKINIEEEMKSSYIDYSMSVSQSLWRVPFPMCATVSSPYTVVSSMV